MKFVIIIPARGGSTRVKNKNIRPLNGRPLLHYSLKCLKEGALLDKTYVSTNDPKIAECAYGCNANVIDRPDTLANATASTESALLHALDVLETQNIYADWIMTLPPTSPFRTLKNIQDVISLAQNSKNDTDCIMSVTENRGDFWCLNGGRFQRLFPHAPRRQQDRDPLFEENSAIYMTRVTSLKETNSVLGHKVEPYYMDALEAIDINDPLDFEIAEAISKSKFRS